MKQIKIKIKEKMLQLMQQKCKDNKITMNNYTKANCTSWKKWINLTNIEHSKTES